MLRHAIEAGGEFCGRVDNHGYQLYGAVNGIERSKAGLRRSPPNATCECSH
jgi:hypothetical protein